MKNIVFSCSQKLHEPALDFYKGILRKTAKRYPDLTVRVTKGATGHTGELIEFCGLMGWTIEKWGPKGVWGNNAATIRNKSMLRGYEFDPERCGKSYRDPETDWPIPVTVKDPADLVLLFSGKSGGDTAYDFIKLALMYGPPLQVHVYNEKWKTPKHKHPTFFGIVHQTRWAKHNRLELDPKESWVWKPEQERQAA